MPHRTILTRGPALVKNRGRARLTLPRLVALLRLVDDVDATLATHEAVVAMAVTQRFQRITDFHDITRRSSREGRTHRRIMRRRSYASNQAHDQGRASLRQRRPCFRPTPAAQSGRAYGRTIRTFEWRLSMRVADVLKSNRQSLATCIPEESITSICTRLSALNIGAFPVCDAHGSLVGIVSERDVVRAFARDGARPADLHVRDLMTREVTTCTQETSMVEAEKLMNKNRVRHLPIMDGLRLVGMLSIRDVMVGGEGGARG